MKLLLIEDDYATTVALRRGLRAVFIVDVARNGSDGVHKFEVGEYDVVVLDLSLPDMAGLAVCQTIRSRSPTVPILILTGVADVRDKVKLLDEGADDYMTKPFSLEELKARLRVLARREQRHGSSVLCLEDLKLDTATRYVERAGVAIELRRKEFALLEYMMHHQGAAITRSTIMEHVWDASDSLWTNAVDVHIKYLRDRVDRPFARPLIHTVHGVGYKIEAPSPAVVHHERR